MNYNSLLINLFLFEDLDFSNIEKKYDLVNNLIIKNYKCNEIILSTNENPIGIGIVSAGYALISTSSQNNSPTLRKLSEGDTFGAASLFSKNRDYSTTVTSESSCSVIYISKETVQLLCEKEPIIALNYIRFLSDRVSFLNRKVSTFSAQSADAKLAYYIYNASGGENKSFTLPLTYSQLADNLALGRASLYRSLDFLCDNKIIERNNKTISVLSTEKLRKIFN